MDRTTLKQRLAIKKLQLVEDLKNKGMSLVTNLNAFRIKHDKN